MERVSYSFSQASVSDFRCKHPTKGGQRGMRYGTARLPSLDPGVRVKHLLLPSRILKRASLGLDRHLLTLMVPLREKVGG